MTKNEPKVLVVILNYKTPQLTLDLVDSLKKINYHQFSIMVIDNASPDDSARILSEYADDKGYIFYANHINAGYAAGNNIGIRYGIEHGYVYSWILNSDVILVDLNVLKCMVNRAESNEKIGVVGPLIVNKDNQEVAPYCHRPSFWRSTLGIFTEQQYRIKHIHSSMPVYRVYGCCMLLKNKAMQKCDCMDERTFLYSEEDILAERLLQYDYYAFYDSSVKVKHNESSSMKTLNLKEVWEKDNIIYKSRALYFKEYLGYNNFLILLIDLVRRFISLYRNI